MRSLARLIVLALSLLVAAPSARAQEAYPAETSTPVTAAAQGAPGGLPVRAAPPRTLRDHWHVYAAFSLAWLLLFGYAVSVGRRFARVEEELRRIGPA